MSERVYAEVEQHGFEPIVIVGVAKAARWGLATLAIAQRSGIMEGVNRGADRLSARGVKQTGKLIPKHGFSGPIYAVDSNPHDMRRWEAQNRVSYTA